VVILRVARPDGTIGAVNDAGDYGAWVTMFCRMTDDERAARWESMVGKEDADGGEYPATAGCDG